MLAGKDFYAKFKWLKAEVLALKQAHDYGLGRVDLTNYDFDITLPAGTYTGKYLYIRISFYNVTEQPIVQFWFDDMSYQFDINVIDFTDGVLTIKSRNASFVANDHIQILFCATAPMTSVDWSLE